MADQITSITANSDLSYSFGFIFDNGNGIQGATVVNLPAPLPTPAVLDGNGNVVTPAIPPVPYTDAQARALVLPIASAQKAAWLTNLQASQIIGPVTL